MRHLVFVILLTGLLLLNGCGESTNINSNRIANTAANTANAIANTAANAVNAIANTVSSATTGSPESFVKNAAQSSKAKMEMGKLASTQGKNPELKKFGQMIVADHQKANAEIEKLAISKKIDPPADLGSHQPSIDRLKGLSGADFDNAYVSLMINDHESDLNTFQKQADNGSDPDVKAFAAKQVPVIKKHLEALKAILAKMK